MYINIRKFEKKDIDNKIKWVNDSRNNKYLHYELPLVYDKTLEWFRRTQGRMDRFDAVIEADGIPVGLIGLLSIDMNNRKAEFYISMGEYEYQGKGVATKASMQLLMYGFYVLNLNRIYLYTEKDNLKAQGLFKKVGFEKEGYLEADLCFKNRFVDRYVYAITKECFEKKKLSRIVSISQIQYIGNMAEENEIYMKRDDLIPISFGGNKARKAFNFFEEIDGGDYDCVVTYGSSSSNHCRIIANMAAVRKLPCYIIGPEESSASTFNSKLMSLFGAEITVVPVTKVHDTIENKLRELKVGGRKPYFIAGGGHGNLGTMAYVNCYEEIKAFELENKLHFDYIFFASGTGTTQAGLVCGQLIYQDDRKIVGISIAREKSRGRKIVVDSINDFFKEKALNISPEEIEKYTIFVDDYRGNGYGENTDEISNTIYDMMINYAIPMDSVYTGKAFCGMKKYLKQFGITGKKILFIHTGGTPLFFDDLRRM